ncbi:GntR family transcriptional regulator [Actinomadura scrupuli]|uniref:GntR family transcriptional regulator n=1 Tax=Actinomadura scrupuli TaxID=559629 RepID=UPI003D97412E
MADAERTLSMTPLAVPAASLADQVAASIRAAVRAGTLQPGRLYSAYQMADNLGVSRSPVREALMRLAEAGMVEFERNRGFRIVIPQPRDIAEVFHLRLLLEVPAARRVASGAAPELIDALRAELREMSRAAGEHDEALFMRHDRRLHDLILGAAGNARLLRLIDGLRDTTRYLGASTVDRSRTLHDIYAEHVPIVDAIAAADAAAAGRAMSAHVTHTGRLLVAQAATESADGTDPDALWAELID